MKNIVLIGFSLLIFMGCGGRIFLADRPRVDQELPGVSPENDSRTKTRKVLVMQFVQPLKTSSSEKLSDDSVDFRNTDTKESSSENDTSSMDLPLPMGIEPAGWHLFAEDPQIYQVQKDDTLQKISKKFYGSFGLWTKIYEYNRDTIADPHRLKPGQKIKIPQYH